MIKLKTLDGKITQMVYGLGLVVDVLMFKCPVKGHEHSHVIPFSDKPAHTKVRDGGREFCVWERTFGVTVDSITFVEPFLHEECGLEGHIRVGYWVPLSACDTIDTEVQ